MEKPNFKIALNISVPVEVQVYDDYTLFYTNSALVSAISKADGEEFTSISDILERCKFLSDYIDKKQVLEFQVNSYKQQIKNIQQQLASVEAELSSIGGNTIDGSKLPPITGTLNVTLDVPQG